MTASSRPLLLFYCQHSLGMGHLVRSLTLAGALAERFRVVLLSGGSLPDCVQLPSAVEVVELPPIGFDDGRQLVSRSETGLAEAQLRRQQMILASYSSLRPSAVVVELFPFGRKKFAAELLPLLEQAANDPNCPVVVCSLRDILVGRSDHDTVTSAERANRYFDAVLVHSDPAFARLEESFQSPTPLQVPIHYTGFVTSNSQQQPASDVTSRPRIVVSAGGGIVGERLLRTAVEAFQLLRATDDIEMKVIAGPFLPQPSWERLREMADGWEGLMLERSVPELFPELCKATASISQCGYNTTLEVLRAGIPALVVPFEDAKETEQTNRARKLSDMGALRMLREQEMNAQRLADEIRALLEFRPKKPNFSFQGAENSARILDELVSNTCSQIASVPLEHTRRAAQ
jgi:predicted glycosyltransferase